MGVYLDGVWREDLADPNPNGGSHLTSGGGGGGGGQQQQQSSGSSGGLPAWAMASPAARDEYWQAMSAGRPFSQQYYDPNSPNGIPGGGGGGGTATGGAGAAGSTGSGQMGFNADAAKAAQAAADSAAQQAYLRARLNLDTEIEARAKGAQAWTQTYQQKSMELSAATSMLQLGSQLRGPQNYAQYARTLNSTPNGIRDLVNAAAGNFKMADYGAAPAGSQYEAASVGGLLRDLNGGVADPLAELAGTAPGTSLTPNATQPVALPSGSQWNAQNMQRILASPTQSGLLQSTYDASGRDWNEELSAFSASLPKYGAGQVQRGRYGVPAAA